MVTDESSNISGKCQHEREEPEETSNLTGKKKYQPPQAGETPPADASRLCLHHRFSLVSNLPLLAHTAGWDLPSFHGHRASLVLQMAKNLLATWETWIRSVGREDPLEKEMATHSSILAWKTLWTEEHGWLQSIRSVESDTATKQQQHLYSRIRK